MGEKGGMVHSSRRGSGQKILQPTIVEMCKTHELIK